MSNTKGMDPQVLMTTMMGVAEDVLGTMSGVTATEPMQTKELDILEYNGRMRCVGMEKFNAPSYVSVVNYYLNAQDLENRKKAKGALVLYVDFENAGKLFKNLGFSISEDEDDASMMGACGEFCNMLGDGFKKEIGKLGFADLAMSAPHNYKNSILEGVEFSSDQTTKYELSFFYWKRKAIVVEITLGVMPMKK